MSTEGRFVINWSRAPWRFAEYRSKKKTMSFRKASNNLRAALLNGYTGAKEYKECQKVNDKGYIIERQFKMPARVFKSLFPDVQCTDDCSEQQTSRSAFEVCRYK